MATHILGGGGRPGSFLFLRSAPLTEDEDLGLEHKPNDNRIDIPPEALEPKPWFATRPGKEVVTEIVDFIKLTGKPYLWRGYTHTKPPTDSKPVYLDEFELPKKFRAPDRRAPCPCCWPSHPKFCDGKIAWFPSEAIVRIIGPDCFKALDADAHQEALDNMRTERQREKDVTFLLSQLPRLSGAVTVASKAAHVADALEQFHRELHDKLRIARLDLWRDVRRDGELRISVKTREIRRARNGDEYFQDSEAEIVAYRLDGYEVLNPNLSIGGGALKNALRTLKRYSDLAESPDPINQMDAVTRHEAAGEISRAITAVRRAVDNLTRWQKFAKPLAINSLRSWGAREGCRTPYHYELAGNRFGFGPNEYNLYSVSIPHDLDQLIGRLGF
jgi:hypothetical protein